MGKVEGSWNELRRTAFQTEIHGTYKLNVFLLTGACSSLRVVVGCLNDFLEYFRDGGPQVLT